MKPKFFKDQAAFAAWLDKNHDVADEIWVGFYKRATGKPSVTWPEAVDVALCYGWIDGIRKGIDDASYMNRITPRRTGSNWSARNIKRVEELIAAKRMRPAGLRAFEARTDDRSAVYSYEQRHEAVLDADFEKRLRGNKKAWAFFESCPPSYRKTAVYWVMSAKRAELRERRLATLIGCSADQRRVPPLTPPARRSQKRS